MSFIRSIFILTLTSLVTLLPLTASAEIYRCKIEGRSVFQDRPCEGVKSEKIQVYTTPSAKQKAEAQQAIERRDAERKRQERFTKLMENQTLAFGMTKDQATQAWGQPCEVREEENNREVWVYCQTEPVHLVTFDNGVISLVTEQPE